MWQKKTQAGALQYVIFISVIIALLLLVFISLNYVQQLFKIQANVFSQLVDITEQEFLASNNTKVTYGRTVKSSNFDNPNFKTTIHKKHWGIFDCISIESTFKAQHYHKIGLLGGNLKNRPVLYLQNNKRPLVLVGTTKIEGTAYLPRKQVKSGYIGGNSYYNTNLIYGNILNSGEDLPKLKNRSYLKQFIQNPVFEDEIPFRLEFGLKETNSFKEPTKTFHSNGVVSLKNMSLTGNYLITSDTLIRVNSSALLTDVILVAPRIEVSKSTHGNFQAFASEGIDIGENCQLIYPTVLLLYVKKEVINKNKYTNSVISVKEGAKIQGVLAYFSDNKTNSYKAQLQLEKNVEIDGEIYCDKNIDSQAHIKGSVFTGGFVAKQFGSVYQNHLYNGSINASKLPVQFAGLPWLTEKQQIAKWLY